LASEELLNLAATLLKPSGDAIAGSSAQWKIEIMWKYTDRKRPSFAEADAV
jgi:hypothetical protein